jgi:hypothetical protein
MKHPALASDSVLDPVTPPAPSRCPYCPAGTAPHWIRWGSYERYAGDTEDSSRKISVPRFRCKIVRRTFSLLPDGLLPYCSQRTALVLRVLHALFVEKVPLSRLADSSSLARGTLRGLRARFLRTVPLLRLPSREGPLPARIFLEVLLGTPSQDVATKLVGLFRAWKEREPKHSIVGIYAR